MLRYEKPPYRTRHGGNFRKEKTPGAIDTTSLGVRGADSQIRTGDLILTKDALYRLSYISMLSFDNERIISQQKHYCKAFFQK